MPSAESSELTNYLDQLIKATREGSIVWKSANPTTYFWERGDAMRGARLSLQRVDRNSPVRVAGRLTMQKTSSYIFQAHEISEGALFLKVSIESADDPEFDERLKTLFDLIKTGLSRKGLDFLKEILPR